MSRPLIDLQSDVKTRPTPAMRRAMAEAEVGDEAAGEDPTVNRLCERVAALLGKEAALFAPSGTQCNQIALCVLGRPGDELICDRSAHILCFEAGGLAANAGLNATALEGERGRYSVAQLEAALRSPSRHAPRQSVLALEQTSNLGGGAIWPLEQIEAVCAVARGHGMKTHMDGARLLNATVATGVSAADYARPFDSAWIDFSKGLGAPVGAALAGSKAFIDEAWRVKQRLGGTMRQAGIIAAGALFALEHHVARLKHDHDNAKALARGLDRMPGVAIDPTWIETNLVYFALDPEHCALDAERFCAALLERGVRMGVYGPRLVRAVTHIDVHANDIDTALAAVEAVLAEAN